MSNLEAIADRVEIEALRGEFTDAAMMRDYDRLASLFTPDGALRIPDANVELAGREEIRAWGRAGPGCRGLPGARADLDRGTGGLGEQVVSLLAQSGPLGGPVNEVVHGGVEPRGQAFQHDDLPGSRSGTPGKRTT